MIGRARQTAIYLGGVSGRRPRVPLDPERLEEAARKAMPADAFAYVKATDGETYVDPPRGSAEPLSSEDIVFDTPAGPVNRILVTAEGLGLVDFALIPHLDHENHEDASLPNAERWAAKLPVPTYAIDDQTAIKVVDGKNEVVSEGHWKLFTPTG